MVVAAQLWAIRCGRGGGAVGAELAAAAGPSSSFSSCASSGTDRFHGGSSAQFLHRGTSSCCCSRGVVVAAAAPGRERGRQRLDCFGWDDAALLQHALVGSKYLLQAPSAQSLLPTCCHVSSRSRRPISSSTTARCLRESGSDEGAVSVSTDDDRNEKDEEAVSHINGRSGALMHNPDENTEADSFLDFGHREYESSVGVEDVENYSSNGAIVGDKAVSRLEEALGAAVVEGTEKAVEVASTTAFSVEVVAETVEVAAQTVSNVGEIEPPLLQTEEQAVVDKAAALKTVAFWVGAAVTFGGLVGFREGTGKASEFFAGYLLEQSLSVDNLFVFVLIFNYFKVPFSYQSRVLTYGIAGAVVFRALMIGLGIASLQACTHVVEQKFEGLNLIFAAVLVFSSFKLVSGADDGEEDLSDNLIVNLCRKFIPVTTIYDGSKFLTTVDGVKKATPLLLTLMVVELSDIAFAVDSIPAVFGVTRDPLIVYSSNIFAILGLRSLYTIISGNMGELEYLQPSVGIVLGFIGAKMIGEFFGFHVPTEVSLGVVAVVLGAGVSLSLSERSKDRQD